VLLFKRAASSTVRFKLGSFCSFKNVMYASISKYVTGKQPHMVTSGTQPEHNRISSSPVQKHKSNPALNDNDACCLAIVMTLPNVDSHISMLLLFILVPGQGTVCVCLSSMDMKHGKTKTRFRTMIKRTTTTEIRIV
jgi:hypothetical protein